VALEDLGLGKEGKERVLGHPANQHRKGRGGHRQLLTILFSRLRRRGHGLEPPWEGVDNRRHKEWLPVPAPFVRITRVES